jgi:hypothetical protein
MGRYITLLGQDGGIVTHASVDPGGCYDTLCGCSASDDEFEQVKTPRGQRIDCAQCAATFRLARTFNARDFTT